uniref:VWA-Hint protein Vwaint domain-containing protein n=1 Tax=Manihot esculenta TaxID=3983 RepID=A0A2C9VN21_MANES
MVEARVAAKNGDLARAVSVLDKCYKSLSETTSAQADDILCVALCVELKEMAYVLSGLSPHSWQRTTARGDSTDSTSLVQAYQTPSRYGNSISDYVVREPIISSKTSTSSVIF